jgi:DNA-binding LacI/PurR family transcriptional regulator
MIEENNGHSLPPMNRGGFITSADVAERAGVSRSAVSRTFTPGASVSPEVKRRVIAAADELGYRVNRLARGLISSRSNLVGLVCANLETPFAAGLLSRTTAALAQRGLHALVFEFNGNPPDVRAEIQRILEFRVEAIVVMSGSPPPSIVDECMANGVKLVLVNRPVVGHGSYNIVSDDQGGAAMAADRLIRAGHTRLAVVASDSGTPTQLRRTAGFVERAGAQGLSVEVTQNGPTSYDAGRLGARALFARSRDCVPDAVFCTTDLLAAGFMDTVRNEFGLAVPNDVSVIGYDDIPQASWGAYQLTTVKQGTHDLSQAIVNAIRNDDGSPDRTSTVGAVLVERATVRA